MAAAFCDLTPNDLAGTAFSVADQRTSHPWQVRGRIDMLVLSRKLGEEITIGDRIRVTIVAILGDKVRLGIAAPPEVIVDRQEIHDQRVKVPAERSEG